MSDVTHYSEVFKGEKSNHGWNARFDKTLPSHCIGISQPTDEGLQRVLLSNKQVMELIRFVQQIHPETRP